MQLSPEWRQWVSCIFEELQHPINLLQMRASSRAFITNTGHLLLNGHSSPAKMVLKGESKWCELQTAAAPKAMAEILFNCSILSSQRQNLLKKIVNATTQRTREEAWSLVAAVIPAEPHSTNSLVLVRFEFGPLPHWVQPQVPRAIHLLLTHSFQGAASPSPLPVQHVGLRSTWLTPAARLGEHTGTVTNNATTWALLP